MSQPAIDAGACASVSEEEIRREERERILALAEQCKLYVPGKDMVLLTGKGLHDVRVEASVLERERIVAIILGMRDYYRNYGFCSMRQTHKRDASCLMQTCDDILAAIRG